MDRQINSIDKTALEEPEVKDDYARGQRDLPVADPEPDDDFARGQRDLAKDPTLPDFAEGQRDLPHDETVESDFARGQRTGERQPI